MPAVPDIKRIPSLPIPAEHSDPTPALLKSVGGRTFVFALATLACATWALNAGHLDASAWTTIALGAMGVIGGSTTAKKVGGAWLHQRGGLGVYASEHMQGADTTPADEHADAEPMVMDVPEDARR